jgi:hypothetical protein
MKGEETFFTYACNKDVKLIIRWHVLRSPPRDVEQANFSREGVLLSKSSSYVGLWKGFQNGKRGIFEVSTPLRKYGLRLAFVMGLGNVSRNDLCLRC